MILYLIRHGKTEGNLSGRYIGTTDEPLCSQGIRELEEKRAVFETLKRPEKVIVTDKLRTRMTAELLFPGVPKVTEPGLTECDFGLFENKNYKELDGDPDYQRWIDSGGSLPFPGGESREDFILRCREAFLKQLEDLSGENYEYAAMVVHGGTLMAVLSELAEPVKGYFEWQVRNGEGFAAHVDENNRRCGERFLYDIRSL